MSTTGYQSTDNAEKAESSASEGIAAPVKKKAVGGWKPRTRRQRWQWNRKLGLISLCVCVVVGIAAAISYHFNSASAADTFRLRAEAAAAANKHAEHEKWLHRYSLLVPSDLDAVVDAALAADEAVEIAGPETLAAAVNHARKQLSRAIGRLGDQKPEQVKELRIRLIERMLQLGGPWLFEAEREVIALQLPENDLQGIKWLAYSLIGQVRNETYKRRSPTKYDKQTDYWNWLANQRVGEVATLAVEQDQEDVDLIVNFLDASTSHTQAFASDVQATEQEAQQWEARLKRSTDQAKATLRSNRDSKSAFSLYRIESSETESLLAAAKVAVERLSELDPAKLGKLQGTVRPDHYWDYMVVLEAAQIMEDQKPKLASAWYQQLTSLDLEDIPKPAKEVAFNRAGWLEFEGGNHDRAVEIWQAGLEQVDADSLALLASIAKARVQDGDPQAGESIEKLQAALQLASLSLLKATEREMPPSARKQVSREIDVAKWQLKIMRGLEEMRAENEIEAIGLLTNVVEAPPANVNAKEYIGIATVLASLHGSQGSWDQAAAVLDKALALEPENTGLRTQVADAWVRAGNRERAAEYWKAAGRSQTLVTRVAGLETSFEQQMQQLPERRDFSGLRSSIQQIRELWGSSIKGSTTESRLAILDAMLPPVGVRAEQHFQSPAFADELVRIAEEFPQDERIQNFTALRLTQLGREDEGQRSIERLEAILGPDSQTLLIIKTQLQAFTGDHVTACDQLIKRAERDPENAQQLLLVAASIATKANDSELVYRALVKIPESERSLGSLFDLARIAERLPPNSEFLSQDGKQISAAELSRQWENRLRDLEGDDGSYWRYLNVQRIIGQLQSQASSETAELREAKKLVREILVQRPRWGAAISLQGWLSAIEGDSEKAVQLLRRGIASGDQDLRTRQKLWEQLIRLDREDEAEQEMRRASLASQSSAYDKSTSVRIGLASIDLALRRGQYEQGVKVAEKAIVDQPKNILAHVVLCRAATLAAGQTSDAKERADLIERASTAIETAADLAGKDRPEVFSARMGLLYVLGDQQRLRDEIERIQASGLDVFNKYTLESRAQLALGDFDTAEALLKRAGDLKQSTQVQLALADLSRRKGDLSGEIEALQKAMISSPENPNIRNLLAHAMVSRDREKVDWGRISELLSVASAASNRFQHALLLINRGTEHQRSEGIEILRQLIRERNKYSDDAARMLAVLLRQRLPGLAENQDSLRDRWLDEIRAIYESLTEREAAKATDLSLYATFILEHGDQKDLPIVKRILARLRSMREGSLYALDVSIRRARKLGDGGAAPEIVKSWVDDVTRAEFIAEPNAAQIAGVTLIRLGFGDEGLGWLEKAYLAKHEFLDAYAVALASVGQLQKGISVCMRQFERDHDLPSAVLLAELLARNAKGLSTEESENVLREALEIHENNPNLLESVATLRLQQEQYDEAIKLYQQVDQINAFRIKTLNNLAMALSEIPGRAAEGIEPIDRAIKMVGEHPELLDTKGVVLLKAGRPVEAEEVFMKALLHSDEPRFRFHLIIALLAQNKVSEAQRAWRLLDVEKLRMTRPQ